VENANSTWRAEPLPDSATGPTGRAILSMVLGLSGCVLLIACANLASLLLARAIDRTREFAVRTALGASRLQLVRTLAFEAFLLAGMGGLAALAVATWTMGWLRSLIVSGGGPAFAFPLDWRVLGFAAAASMVTLIFCGTVPALFVGRLGPNATLKAGGRGTIGGAPRHVRHGLLVAQFALAMILMAGSGFFLRGMANLRTAHFGWNADGVVQTEIRLPPERYPDDASVLAFYQELVARTELVPGIESASVSYGLPYLGLRGAGRYAADDQTPDKLVISALVNGVSASYFSVTGTPLVAGRVFGPTDSASSQKVAIVSESLARALFAGANPIGRRIAGVDAQPTEWLEIVGVVADVRPIDVAEPVSPYQLYELTVQSPRRDATLAVRTVGVTAASVMTSIRATIADLDRDLVARDLIPITAKMDREAISAMSMVQQLLTAFAATGLLLAVSGIYSAMMRMVSQRTGEIGLRMALGAQVASVMGLVLRAGFRIVAIGAGLGLFGAMGLSRVLASVLPGMSMNGALVSVAALAGLMTIALLACYLPARRAARVDPIVALRSE
jgi:predicted permease